MQTAAGGASVREGRLQVAVREHDLARDARQRLGDERGRSSPFGLAADVVGVGRTPRERADADVVGPAGAAGAVELVGR